MFFDGYRRLYLVGIDDLGDYSKKIGNSLTPISNYDDITTYNPGRFKMHIYT